MIHETCIINRDSPYLLHERGLDSGYLILWKCISTLVEYVIVPDLPGLW